MSSRYWVQWKSMHLKWSNHYLRWKQTSWSYSMNTLSMLHDHTSTSKKTVLIGTQSPVNFTETRYHFIQISGLLQYCKLFLQNINLKYPTDVLLIKSGLGQSQMSHFQIFSRFLNYPACPVPQKHNLVEIFNRHWCHLIRTGCQYQRH